MVTKKEYDELNEKFKESYQMVRKQTINLRKYLKLEETLNEEIRFLKQQVSEIKRIAENTGGQLAVYKKHYMLMEELLKKNNIKYGEINGE